MTSEQAHGLIFDMLDAFIDFGRPVEDLAAFLTPDFRQLADGETFDLEGFVDHVRALRSVLAKLDIEIEHFVSDGVSAATVHVAHMVRKSGETGQVKVVAFYKFRDGRLCMVDELTRPLQQGRGDEYLGSIRSA